MPLLLFITTVLIWGSTWYGIKFQLGIVPPEVSVVYRFALASLLLFIFCILSKRNLVFSYTQHKSILFQAIFLYSTNYIFTYYSTLTLTSGMVAVIFSSVVCMNIINSMLFLGEKPAKPVIAGSFLGLLGIGLLFRDEIITASESDGVILGLIYALIGTYLASLGNIIAAKNQINKIPILQTNAFGMLYGACICLAYVIISGKSFVVDTSFNYIASLMYLTIFGTIIAFGAYLKLLSYWGPSRAGYVAILYPVVALTISSIFENYIWSILGLLGLGLIFIGNVLILNIRGIRPTTQVAE